jgi:hypothetical protein
MGLISTKQLAALTRVENPAAVGAPEASSTTTLAKQPFEGGIGGNEM